MTSEVLQQTYFLKNSLESWGIALIVTALTYSALKLFQCYGVKRLKTIAQATSTELDDLVVSVLAHTKSYFVLALSILAGMNFLEVPVLRETHLHFFLVLIIAFQLGIWGNVGISYFLKRQANGDQGKATTMIAVGFIGRLGLWATILLLVLDNLGFNVSTLVTGLGISGVAVALAVQNVLGDLLASLAIVLDKPFVIGDTIQMGENIGTVEKIGLKTTRLKSLSGEQLIYANADLLKTEIRNYKRMQERRVLFILGVTYDTPGDKLKKIPEIVKDIITNEPNARFDRCHLMNFNASSLDFETVYYVLSSDYTVYCNTQQNIFLALVAEFRNESIEFAFPTQTVHLLQEGKIN